VKYILVILMTMGVVGEEPKTIEMRIPQENREECLKSAKTFKFSLPIPMVTVSTQTRCEPRLDNEEPEIRGVKT
jgi:hypothetical protein